MLSRASRENVFSSIVNKIMVLLTMAKIRYICITLSIIVHTGFIGMMEGRGYLQQWLSIMPPEPQQELQLQFVDTPEEVPAEEGDTQLSKLISDKTVKAKDEFEELDVEDSASRSKEIEKGRQLPEDSQAPQKVQQPVEKQVPEQRDVQPEPQMEQKKEISEDAILPQPAEEKPQPEMLLAKLDQPIKQIQEQLQPPMPPREKSEDFVSLPEVTEDIFSTKYKGELIFETSYHKMGPYFKELKKKIQVYWLSYLLFKYPNTAPEDSETTVAFKILPSGEVDSIEVVEYSGDEIFRDFCVATINNTAPYSPLPEEVVEEMEKEALEVVFTFRFR